MHRAFLAAIIIGVSFLIHDAQAGKVKTWYHAKPADFEKAKLKQAVVSNQGNIRLSKQLRPLAKLDAAHVWSVVEDPQGNLYVATGDEGKIFKVAPNGSASLLAESKDSQIFCLARTTEGVLYAGTGPGGSILRIDNGKTTVVAKGLGNYVWSLAYDPLGKALYAGTGPKGEIFKIVGDGKADVFYDTKQDHILSLAFDAPHLFAGTDKGGLVYRIDPKGKGFVLFHAAQNEVRSLVIADHVVYAGTAAPASKRLPTSPTKPGSPVAPSPGGSSSSGGSTAAAVKPEKANTGTTSTFATDQPKGSPASAPSTPVAGDNSLYRIRPDGAVRELFRERTLVLGVLRLDNRLLVGTGMQGQLFEIDEETKERTEIARLDHGQIHCLLQRKDGSIVLGVGDPGKLYVLEDRYAPVGAVVSEPLDAKLMSTWGAITWKGSTPPGTSVSLAVRSGNVPEPDDTWSDWSAEQTDPENARAIAPTARYLQYRLTLATKDPQASPDVRQVVLRYQTSNQAPEITSLDVPDLTAVNLDQPKKFKIKWNATDPNEDELSYRVFVRKEGWKDWVLLEENLDKREFEWDTTTAPSGLYQVKVVASDSPDNPPKELLTAEKISPQVPITHLPPTVAVQLAGIDGIDGAKATLEATATDPLVRLVEASYTVDGKRWTSLFPIDGLFDSKTERFRFQTDALRPGAHVILVRVRDAAGNLGSGDVVFTVGEKK